MIPFALFAGASASNPLWLGGLRQSPSWLKEGSACCFTATVTISQ